MDAQRLVISPEYAAGALAAIRDVQGRLRGGSPDILGRINQFQKDTLGACTCEDGSGIPYNQLNGVAPVEGWQSMAAAASVNFTFTDTSLNHYLGPLYAATDDAVSGDLYLEITQVVHGALILFQPNPSGRGLGVAMFKRDATNRHQFWPTGYLLEKNDKLVISTKNTHGATAVIARLDIAPVTR